MAAPSLESTIPSPEQEALQPPDLLAQLLTLLAGGAGMSSFGSRIAEKPVEKAIQEYLTLYRGQAPGRQGMGSFFTADRALAEQFARQTAGFGSPARAAIPEVNSLRIPSQYADRYRSLLQPLSQLIHAAQGTNPLPGEYFIPPDIANFLRSGIK